MMSRRDALRRFILTLLAIVFGPRVLEQIDEDELETFVGYAEARLRPGFVRLTNIRDRVHQPFRDTLMSSFASGALLEHVGRLFSLPPGEEP